MADRHCIFAWTETNAPEGFPGYVNISRDENGKHTITVRSRGNAGRDTAIVEIPPEALESLLGDLAADLYRDEADRLMAMPEAEVDAELRRLGIDPAEAERQGKAAVEGALEAIRARTAGVAPSDDLNYYAACERQNVALLEAIGYPHEKNTMVSPEEYAADLKRKADAFDGAEPGPLLMFSLNYINGFMVGESEEVRRHWKRIYAHVYGVDGPLAGQQEPIPDRVYWAPLADNFYDADGKGQGNEFYRKWKPRCAEFPQGESHGWGPGSAHNPFKDPPRAPKDGVDLPDGAKR